MNMSKKLFFYLLFLLPLGLWAQFGGDKVDPAQWNFEVKKISGKEYDLIFKADIEEDWHIYSQFTPEGGALPMEITFDKAGEDYKLIGKAKEEAIVTQFNEIFGVDEAFFKEKIVIIQRIELLNPEVKTIQGSVFYQACIDVCVNQEKDFVFSLDGQKAEVSYKEVDERSQKMAEALKLPLVNKELIYQDKNSSKNSESSGYWSIFILGFLGGFIALLTPCVFPMIPLTVSFFTKQNKNRKKGIFNAVLYGFFIFLIYILLSVPFHFLDSINPEILNTISTNIWLNVGFFVIFVFFAFSFFGYYELTLPASWSNKMDNASNIGGIIGIFFMALTLAIVSFSCTGPILGSLLAGSLTAEGGAWQLTAGMAGFGTSLALPFAVFALFPNLLNSLPKSGGWMTTVKVILGFLELAFAFKFLSNADLVAHWGILKRETFIAIWFVLSLLLALYLFGVYRFPHDGKTKPSKVRIGIGVISLCFSVYLFLGLLGKNQLRVLSGFPPPTFYSYANSQEDNNCPLGLNCFKSFEKGLAYAKKVNKPILLDFTGWACVNCRKMEEHVWSDPSVHRIMENDYVLISLYIDDRAELPKDEQFDFQFSSGRVKEIKTIGEKWSTFQSINFDTASQPYYVLLSPNLEVLTVPVQYTDVATYKNWLEEGLNKFNSLK